MKVKRLLAVAGLSVGVWAIGAGPTRAQTTRTYAGANNGDWFTATNWTRGASPVAR